LRKSINILKGIDQLIEEVFMKNILFVTATNKHTPIYVLIDRYFVVTKRIMWASISILQSIQKGMGCVICA